MDNDILQTIQLKMRDVLETDPEIFCRFLLLQCNEDEIMTYIRSLIMQFGHDALFKSIVMRLMEDDKKSENDAKLREIVEYIWNNFMMDDTEVEKNSVQEWALAIPGNSILSSMQFSFVNTVKRLSTAQFSSLQVYLQSFQGTGRLQNAVQIARKCKSVVKVDLVVCSLAFDVIQNIKRWWKGEISETRCVKNILDCGLSVAAGIVGGIGGEVVGMGFGSMIAGPVGGVIGAIAGAVVGSACALTGAQVLADRLTQWIFGLPKSEALANAYLFLRLPPSSSNSEINTQYRKLALQYHPDKGGDKDKWTQLQYSLAVIREARREQ
ncbi:uncharacterized protein LOC128218814 [Mya arenaria]|uniref:uncharacterized protein LOC128218814 n=1 Tax=Mya arenaria TaxID=6604 RepID=UPI0022E786DE|nr:uncharacterized protein LOC128218814 [Mya arenaria]